MTEYANVQKKICKKCLLRELEGEEKAFQTIRAYLEAIPEEDKADKQLYERRLEHCKSCEKLLQGMCRSCGCYVEVRAVRQKGYCPERYW